MRAPLLVFKHECILGRKPLCLEACLSQRKLGNSSARASEGGYRLSASRGCIVGQTLQKCFPVTAAQFDRR
jgi:hypothetical protein